MPKIKLKQKKKAAMRAAKDEEGVSETEEIELLLERCKKEAPDEGVQGTSNGALRFDSLPISRNTLMALDNAKFEICTEIQAAAIPHALAGRDILGAAKTGSGKTLAFIIPVIERLYTERWTRDDGLGALIISPTRELAMQIFEVLRVVGKKHDFSAGLVTGGKKEYQEEQGMITMMNILVATPGRLLAHLEETAGFDSSMLQLLVLDEADRILDMGFQAQLDGILGYLPSTRQTMLFSATQTKSIKDLARLSLKKAQYLAVRDKKGGLGGELGVTSASLGEGNGEEGAGEDAGDDESGAGKLHQSYVVVKLQDKLDVLFSFIKSHLKHKIIIFFSTCSQCRFVHEIFRGMQPGIPLTALHGKIKQERRTLIYQDFSRRQHACMLATDIAARGLDFPDVNWVIQVDAPEDPAMYIHRVGRTARHTAAGRAMLMLTEQEKDPMLALLAAKKIQVKRLTVNPKRAFSVANKAASLLAREPDYRLLAKKSFTGYLRSLLLLPHLAWDFSKIDYDAFARSLGLGITPPLPKGVAEAAENGGRPVAVGSKAKGKTGDLGDTQAEANGVVNGNAVGQALRAEIRSKKNVNRGLDKLKRQIKETKLRKKIEKGLRARGIDPEGEEGTALVEAMQKELRDKEAGAVAAANNKAPPASAFHTAEGEDDEDDDKFLVKKSKNSGDDAASRQRQRQEDLAAIAAFERDAGLSMKKKKSKDKPLKISAEGVAKAVLRADQTASGGSIGAGKNKRKIRFDEDGEAIDDGVSIYDKSHAPEEAGADTAEIDEYTRKVKQRVDAGRTEDNLRERERVKAKRQKKKEQGRARKGDGDEESDGSEAPRLGGYDSGSGGDSGGKYGMSVDSDGSDNDSDDAAALERKALSMMS